ncbi:MAG: cysteine--tRNA ligase [Verrucomicrobiota bacterium]
MTLTPKFYNSLTRKVESFQPLKADKVKMYTCGPTVYDYAHIGNFRAYVFEDILRRTLEYAGFEITQVMNLTDVDDKTIANARKQGIALTDYTAKYKEAFFEDIRTLRIKQAEYYPEATKHVDKMIEIVQRLLTKGYAYRAEDGSVYFSIAAFPDYGQLVNIDPAQLQTSARVKNDEYEKESLADFALWKAHTPEDGDVGWDSPWGFGRPGWHIECSAMSECYLGKTFDIHTGGVDNMFPHHEDEIAQSEAANGCRFVNYWLHCAHLIVEGEKMSKSLGNFYTLRELLEQGFSGRELRYVLMSTHYRQQLNFTMKGCHDARTALRRVDEMVYRLQEPERGNNSQKNVEARTVTELIEKNEKEFTDCLLDDLNISGALGALFRLIRSVNKLLDEHSLDASEAEQVRNYLQRCDKVLGVLDIEDKQKEIPEYVKHRLEERQQARKAKDFKKADAIRDELKAEGWVIEDTPKGPIVKNV